MNGRNRPGVWPTVQRLEGRELLSAIMNLLGNASRTGHGAIDARGTVAARQDLPPNPLLFPSGTPTPQQQARQTFVARFQGTFSVGPGRFSSEAQQLFIRGA